MSRTFRAFFLAFAAVFILWIACASASNAWMRIGNLMGLASIERRIDCIADRFKVPSDISPLSCKEADAQEIEWHRYWANPPRYYVWSKEDRVKDHRAWLVQHGERVTP